MWDFCLSLTYPVLRVKAVESAESFFFFQSNPHFSSGYFHALVLTSLCRLTLENLSPEEVQLYFTMYV